MRKFFSIIISVGVLFISSCKKEDTSCIEENTTTYNSTTIAGESGTGILVSINSLSSSAPDHCNGIFLFEIGNNPKYTEFDLQVVEGLPDSLKIWDNYHEKEFLIDIEFLGIGYGCINGSSDYSGKLNIELVRITHIEEAL